MADVVWAKRVTGWNMSLAQLFGSGPKMLIVCGKCGGSFTKRIPISNYPVVSCPCGAANKLNVKVTR